jgi:hypothetical protein
MAIHTYKNHLYAYILNFKPIDYPNWLATRGVKIFGLNSYPEHNNMLCYNNKNKLFKQMKHEKLINYKLKISNI